MRQTLTIAFVTDSGFFLPTLRAAHSALRHAAAPLRIVFVGTDLENWMWQAVDQVAIHHAASQLEKIVLPPNWLKHAYSPNSSITRAALGRMFLPRLTGGRILYLDGDTLVTGDLTQAAKIDLSGRPLGAVRDYAVMNWLRIGKDAPLKRQSEVLGGRSNLRGYVNSGVLLLDSDTIRATPELSMQMEDMHASQGFPAPDQDRINMIFEGHITYLDPAWNCSWGRLRRQQRLDFQPSCAAPPRCDPIILHFHGPHKPWQKLRLSSLRKGAGAVLRYRIEMAMFHRTFPDIP